MALAANRPFAVLFVDHEHWSPAKAHGIARQNPAKPPTDRRATTVRSRLTGVPLASFHAGQYLQVRIPSADLKFDVCNLPVTASDSRRLLQAMLGDFVKRPPVAVESRLQARVILPPANYTICIPRIDFHQSCLSPTPLTSD